MSQELIYTSAPRGLKPGSRGFCTVISSEGMAQNLAEQLEALSGYRHLFGPHDAQARLNPVLWSHLKLTVGGRPYHVLSRIADAGLDYTNRTNKFAHHVALDRGETVPAGPAWVLSQPGFMETAWDGTPRIVPAGRRPPRADVSPAVCTAWQAATGDAGWGGALAETALANRPALIIYRPGTSVLPLVAESLALVPPDRRWDVTFCTYFTRLPPGIHCLWRCVIEGTSEASTARTPQSLIINLTAHARAPDSPWTEAARTGRIPPGLWPATEPQAVLPLHRMGDLAELEREIAAEVQRSDRDWAGSRVPPPRATEPAPIGVAPPAIRSLGSPQPVGRAPDSGRFAPGARRPKRRLWLVAAVVLLAIAGLSAGVLMSLPDNLRSRLAGSEDWPRGGGGNGPPRPAPPAAATGTGASKDPMTGGGPSGPTEGNPSSAPAGTGNSTAGSPNTAAPPSASPSNIPAAPTGTAASKDPMTGGGPGGSTEGNASSAPAGTGNSTAAPTDTAATPPASTEEKQPVHSAPSSPPADPPKPPDPPKFYYVGSVVGDKSADKGDGDKSKITVETQGDPPVTWVLKPPAVEKSALQSGGGGASDFPDYKIFLEGGKLRGFQSKHDPLDLRVCIVDYDGKLHQFFEPVRFVDVFTRTIASGGQKIVDKPISFGGEPPLKNLTPKHQELCSSRLVFRDASLRNLPQGYEQLAAVYWGDCVAIRIDGPSPPQHSGEGRIPMYLFAKASLSNDGKVTIGLFHAIEAPDWLIKIKQEIDSLRSVSGFPSEWTNGADSLNTNLGEAKLNIARTNAHVHVKSRPESWPKVENLRRIGWNPFDLALNKHKLFSETKITPEFDRHVKERNMYDTLEDFKSYGKILTQVSADLKALFGPDSQCKLEFDLVIPFDGEGKPELVVATTRDPQTRPVHVIPLGDKP